MGLSPDRIVVTPYVIDNDWFADRARLFDRTQIRQAWGIPPEALVVLFCAKFLPRKRPLDVIRAFAQADIEDAYLVLAGDGPLREQMADLCEKIGVLGKVKFIGIVPYSELPGVYSAADLLVVASSHEPWGLPVNEAMVCGTPVIVSDRVGARYDLVQEGETGFVYPCGDVQALAKIFREVLPDRERLKRMGEAARKRMKTWSPKENVEAFVQAVEKAVQRKRGTEA
jgi:glycosyltransferase involved in cell wall biosynthesis